MKKKHSVRNGKLKANSTSETEEQRKERLRIGREKDRARRITKKLQEEKKGHQKQETMRNIACPCSWRSVVLEVLLAFVRMRV